MRGDSYYQRAYEGTRDYEDFDRAILDYNHAIGLDSQYKIVVRSNLLLAYNNRGVNFRSLGMYDKAIEYHTRALDLVPDDANSYDMRARAYHEKGDYRNAIADYNHYLKLRPNDMYARKRLQKAMEGKKYDGMI